MYRTITFILLFRVLNCYGNHLGLRAGTHFRQCVLL